MRRSSFRLRIAGLSALLAGTAMIGLGIVAGWLIYDAKVKRLDADLTNYLGRVVRPGRRYQRFWETVAGDPANPFRDPAIALQLIESSGERHQSDNWDPDLNLQSFLAALPRPLPPPLPPPGFDHPGFPPDPPPDAPLPPQFITQQTATALWRVGAVSLPNGQIAIAMNLQTVDEEMASIRTIFLLAIPTLLVLVAGGAWILSSRALAPIQQLTSTIQLVTAKGLNYRVPSAATDVEFIELIHVFNQMLERLERSFNQASRFSADAAHELKTPLTILQGELEQAMQQATPGSTEQIRLSHLLEEVQRLSSIIRKLLLLSLADAGHLQVAQTTVDLSQLLTEMAEDIALLAPHLEVKTAIAQGLTVRGDRDLLTQLLQNLISNAIKYNLPQGWIRIEGRYQGATPLITITNASRTIPAAERDRLFDRFYRGDPARTRHVDGIGLGLSLAQEIARAHRGTLRLDATQPQQTAVTLQLRDVRENKIPLVP